MRRIFASAILMFAGHLVWAQQDTVTKKRLRNTAVVTGVIGGESHDSYVVHARAGETMKVEISW